MLTVEDVSRTFRLFFLASGLTSGLTSSPSNGGVFDPRAPQCPPLDERGVSQEFQEFLTEKCWWNLKFPPFGDQTLLCHRPLVGNSWSIFDRGNSWFLSWGWRSWDRPWALKAQEPQDEEPEFRNLSSLAPKASH